MLRVSTLIIAMTGFIGLAGCTPTTDESPNETASTANVDETTLDESDDVSGELPDVSSPNLSPVVVFESDVVSPNAEGEIPGNATFLGTETLLDSSMQFSRIADESSERYLYYTAMNEDLDPGVYSLLVLATQDAGRTVEMMVRIQSGSDEDRNRSDLIVAANGEIARNRGSFEEANVQTNAENGTQMITARFTVSDVSSNPHQVIIYPAIGRDGILDSGATGQIGVGPIILTKIE